MRILGIESSCDDTSVALIDASDKGLFVIAEKTASQIDIHKKYGGVVPEIAGRAHAEQILPVVEEVMKNQEKPDAIAVTSGPGLITGLLVGVEVAKTLSYLWNVPLIGMNHIEGHIHSTLLEEQDGPKNLQFPALCLIVSGGHTSLILMKNFGDYELLGNTRDDAAGEAFDKAAKLLQFDYPGGPKISKYAEAGNPNVIPFPRPMMHDDNLDFSFAGLKTAALYWLRDNALAVADPNPITLPTGIFATPSRAITLNDFCASYEQAIVDVLVAKTMKAAKKYKPKTILLAGGVSANKKLRETLQKETAELSPAPIMKVPTPGYYMDNAAMIAAAAYHHAKKKEFTNWKEINADPNWKVYEKK